MVGWDGIAKHSSSRLRVGRVRTEQRSRCDGSGFDRSEKAPRDLGALYIACSKRLTKGNDLVYYLLEIMIKDDFR